MILCDTNVFIDFFNGKKATFEGFEKIGMDNVLISSISIIELLKGSENKKQQSILIRNLESVSVLDFDERVSIRSIELIKNYHLSHNLHLADSIIAASSLVFDIELFTYSLKDFKYITGIKLYKS